jgi:methylated-DNA-[protein]-cysteine S-methyltransferase
VEPVRAGAVPRCGRFIVPAPFGALAVELREGALWTLELSPRRATRFRCEPPAPIVAALRRYLRDPTTPWSLPVVARGTPFQRRVWAALRRIPVGRTVTYGALAARLGSAPRAVGAACRANPVALVVPCHRVVASVGLGGYQGRSAGPGVEIKRWLLRHEGALPEG